MNGSLSNDDDAQRPNGGWTNRSIYELLVEIDKRHESQMRGVYDAIGAADKRYEQRFLAQEKAVDSALIEREKATTKAEIAAEKRFDALAETFTEKIDSLATSRDTSGGFGHGLSVAWGVAIGAVTIIASYFVATHANNLPIGK